MHGDRVFRNRSARPGFTLVEQLVAVAVATILACLAAPSFLPLLERQQLGVAQAELVGILAHARETAVRTGIRTVLCPSRDGRRCSEQTHWESGWILGYDRDHDEQPDEPPLRIGQANGQRLIVQSTAGRTHVRFLADGSASGSNLTFSICRNADPERALIVAVALSGRIRGAPASAEQAAACAETE